MMLSLLLALVAMSGGWKPLPIWGGGYMVDAVIARTNPQIVYAHADVCGPFRSDDGGLSWRPLHQNFPAAWRNTKVDHVRGLLVDPRNADRVTVAGGDSWNLMGGGIVVSDDGGQHWRMTLKGGKFFGNGLHGKLGRILDRDPSDPDALVAGEVGGIWVSRDNGETWKNKGLTNCWFTCVQFDRSVKGRIWATATNDGYARRGLVMDEGFFLSDDYGETWRQLKVECAPTEFTQMRKGGPIVAVVKRQYAIVSEDAGATWKRFSEGLFIREKFETQWWSKGNYLALGAGSNFYLIGDGNGNIYRRGEKDSAWTKIERESRTVGDPACEIWLPTMTRSFEALCTFTVDESDENRWLVTDWFSLYETKDGGSNFVTRQKGIQQLVPFMMAFDPMSADNIAYGVADMGLFLSRDGGKSFFLPLYRKAKNPNERNVIAINAGNSISYSTKTPGLIFITGGKGETQFGYSADGGETWHRPAKKGLPAKMVNGGIAPYSVTVHPVTDDVWITMGGECGRGKGGIYVSHDRGENFEWAGEGLPEGEKLFRFLEFGNNARQEILFSADGSAAIARACTAGKVFYLDTQTGRWQASAGFGNQPVRSQADCDAFTPGRFFVGGMESTDGGRTFHKLEGLKKAWSVAGFAADAHVKGLLAAVADDRILISRNGGKTFEVLENGFESVPSSLRRDIYLDRGKLYFLTTGTGVWVRQAYPGF